MNRLNKNTHDSCTFCSPDVRKKLIADKDGGVLFSSHQLHRLFIILRGGLVCIKNVFTFHTLGKGLHPWLLIVRNKAGIETNVPQPAEQSHRTHISRRSVGYQCIIYIKNQASISQMI